MTSHMHEKSTRVAVVEDDADLLDTMLEYLKIQGYPAWGVCNAGDFYRRFSADAVDVIVLDIGLPGEDGISIARHLRELPNLTVIIASARDALEDRLVGFKAGADRYLVKPVDLIELVANIEAVGRRSANLASSFATGLIQEEKPKTGLWRLAKHDWRLTVPDGKSLGLTAREFLLLKCLFEANGETVSRRVIADKIIGSRIFNSDERLDVMLARLRKKCMANLGQSLPVKTVHQVGYAFTAPAVIE
ncbi:MAG: response regulator transcription factor [Gallionella sp.]|nr:response regulator transcription factor [Gallionella sp.]